MTAGYFGGKIDDLLSLVMNVFLIIPALPLLVILVGVPRQRRLVVFRRSS